jgi:hypothetical protein
MRGHLAGRFRNPHSGVRFGVYYGLIVSVFASIRLSWFEAERMTARIIFPVIAGAINAGLCGGGLWYALVGTADVALTMRFGSGIGLLIGFLAHVTYGVIAGTPVVLYGIVVGIVTGAPPEARGIAEIASPMSGLVLGAVSPCRAPAR